MSSKSIFKPKVRKIFKKSSALLLSMLMVTPAIAYCLSISIQDASAAELPELVAGAKFMDCFPANNKDESFQKFVWQNILNKGNWEINGDKDTYVFTDADVSKIKSIGELKTETYPEMRLVTDFTGLKQFTYLNTFWLEDFSVNLRSLDLSNLTSLMNIKISAGSDDIHHPIYNISLDISGDKNLRYLTINNTMLTSLPELPEDLQVLDCKYNNLTAFPELPSSFGSYTKMSMGVIELAGNKIKEIDTEKIPDLTQYLDLSDNLLTSFNCKKTFSLLYSINLSNNELTDLDIQGLNRIKSLDVSHNKLTSLKIPDNFSYLATVLANDNKLETIDVSGAGSLSKFDCSNNNLTTLDLRDREVALGTVNASNNSLVDVNLSGSRYTNIDLSNNKLRSLSELSAGLYQLTVNNNELQDLNIEHCLNLRSLSAANNKLTRVILPTNKTYLTAVDLSNNQLASLDVCGYTKLIRLLLANNRLTSLNLEGCTIFPKYLSNSSQFDVSNQRAEFLYSVNKDNANKITIFNVPNGDKVSDFTLNHTQFDESGNMIYSAIPISLSYKYDTGLDYINSENIYLTVNGPLVLMPQED